MNKQHLDANYGSYFVAELELRNMLEFVKKITYTCECGKCVKVVDKDRHIKTHILKNPTK